MADQSAAKTILLIDDDEDLAFALARVLSSAGYEVRQAGDGEEGVSLAVEAPPDLILLDFMMPGVDGFEACRRIRAIPELSGVPIIALTAFGQNIGEIHGMRQAEGFEGIQDYLEKPVEPNVFLARVAAALR
jgi:DNA-binding response OmpR family regulator